MLLKKSVILLYNHPPPPRRRILILCRKNERQAASKQAIRRYVYDLFSYCSIQLFILAFLLLLCISLQS